MGQVWQLIERHQDEAPYRPSVRQIARAAGMNESTLPKWQNLSRMPEPEHLKSIARQINVPYRVLLEAALVDCGYVQPAPAQLSSTGTLRVASTQTTLQPKLGLDVDEPQVPLSEELDQIQAAAHRPRRRKP